MEEMDSSRFFRVYDNIPITARKELVLIVDDKPVSWDIAYIEIEAKTPLGAKIFKKLVELDFI
ncbi:MAG: hypothetical protein JW727_05055 [Candidatus Aenigmarchaeota archaeon]|nr:hypothetical protein [Candidatus Aenigmarchaeota archaeon]